MPRVVVVALLVLGIAACRGGGTGPAGLEDPAGELVEARYIVLDSSTVSPISGATVLADTHQGVTDEAGEVVLMVPRGTVQVVAFVAGYDAGTILATAPGLPRQLLLRPAAPRISACRLRGSLLEAVATDFAGRKTILRRARTEVTLEGPEFGAVTVPVLSWAWKAVDPWSYVVTVPRPAGELTRATWRVYDRELNVAPVECDPRVPSGPL